MGFGSSNHPTANMHGNNAGEAMHAFLHELGLHRAFDIKLITCQDIVTRG